jgi:hypothetical protein
LNRLFSQSIFEVRIPRIGRIIINFSWAHTFQFSVLIFTEL